MEKMKGIKKRDFDLFTKNMWQRLKAGEKKYGVTYKNANIKKAMLEEAVDLSNYSFMLFLQANKFNKSVK